MARRPATLPQIPSPGDPKPKSSGVYARESLISPSIFNAELTDRLRGEREGEHT